MTTTVLRTADGWYVLTDTGAVQIDTTAATTAGAAAPTGPPSRPPRTSPAASPSSTLDLVSPVTAPCRVVAQMTNYPHTSTIRAWIRRRSR